MKQLKTIGEIIAWEEENGKHYPVFKFITKDNKEIIARNKKNIDYKHDYEISLENLYNPEFIPKILEAPLPFGKIHIMYEESDPYIFIPIRWIDRDPEVFYNPEKRKKVNKNENIIKFFLVYIFIMLFNFLFPLFSVTFSSFKSLRYFEEYGFEHRTSVLVKFILYCILLIYSMFCLVLLSL